MMGKLPRFSLICFTLACETGKGDGPGSGGVGDDTAAESGDDWVDEDGDGYYGAEDCDDGDPSLHPNANELCDSIDNDCDGEVDDGIDVTWYVDGDGDGYGDPDDTVLACDRPSDATPSGNDCDDEQMAVYPGAPELCDLLDNDCDEEIDEGLPAEDYDWYYLDEDGDGFGSAEDALSACAAPVGYAANARDCDDGEPSVYPGAQELDGDGLTNDCESCWGDGECDLGDAPARLLGDVESGGAGAGLAGLGDWEADGDAELAIGAPKQDDGAATQAGSVAILSGPWVGDRAMSEALVRLRGDEALQALGTSLLALPDIDGDDANELVVGGPGGAGGAWILSSGLRGDLTLDDALVWFEGEDDGDEAGGALAGGDDLDGDDAPDLLIGAARWPELGDVGAIYLVSASPDGHVRLEDGAARLEGEASGDGAGAALATGDADGDGLMDAAVGAPGMDEGGRASGGVALVLGRADAGGALEDADGRWIGGAASDAAGTAVALLDLDGDGLAELVVGAPGEDAAGGEAGAVYRVVTPARAGSLTDADGALLGEDDRCELGATLLDVGDTDVDGAMDLAVGQPGCRAGGPGYGSAAVLQGAWSGAVDLDDVAVRFTGTESDARAGEALGRAGDVDGDGRSDLLVGAPESDAALPGAGLGWLVYGAGEP